MLHKLSVFTLMIFSIAGLSCGKLRIPKAASTIALTTTTANWTAGLCVPVTLSLTSAGCSFFVPGTTNAQISLAGSLANVKFFESSSDCAATTPAVTATTIASATSTKTIYVRSTTSGTLTLTATLTGYSNTPSAVSLVSTQNFTVMADTPVDYIFTRQSAPTTDLSLADTLSKSTGSCTGYYIYFKDTYGNRVTASDYATLYTGTYAGLTMNMDRPTVPDTSTVRYNASDCISGVVVNDNWVAVPVTNAFTTYPAIFSIDPSTSAGGVVFTLVHTLVGGPSPTPTFTVTVNP